MEALRQSLERVSTTKKRTAKIEAGRAKSAETGRNRAEKKRARG
jgi:hypothetical protein